MATLFDWKQAPPPPKPVSRTPVITVSPPIKREAKQKEVAVRTVPVRNNTEHNPWGYVKTPFRWGTVIVTVDELFNELCWLRNRGYGKEELVLQMRKTCDDPGFQRPYERKGVVILPYQNAEDVVL